MSSTDQAPAEELTEQIAQLNKTADELKTKITEAAASGEGFAEAKAGLEQVQNDLAPLIAKANQEKRDTEAKAVLAGLENLQKQMSDLRTPSKAAQIGSIASYAPQGDPFNEYFATVAMANSPRLAGGFQASIDAKATLDEMGSAWAGVHPESKATVGDTDAAGGYLVPNPVLADINLRATAPRSVVDLFDVVNDVGGSSVDIPWEQEAIARAVIAAPGATKENSNLIVNNYNAQLYTLARIFDIGNQLLRQSRGAAERLVRSKLARAFGLGEDYYALNGSGSSQPYGLLTALGTSGDHVTTFSSPSDSTVAGSIIAAVLTAAGELADLGAVPDGVVLNSGDFYRAWRQGTNEAGFFSDPFRSIAAIGQDVAGPGGFRWRHSPNMPSDSIVVGEFGTTQFFRGQGYRVDSSSEAGDRWDKNLTGFRGEEEIAFDARPAVYTLKFKRIVNAHA